MSPTGRVWGGMTRRQGITVGVSLVALAFAAGVGVQAQLPYLAHVLLDVGVWSDGEQRIAQMTGAITTDGAQLFGGVFTLDNYAPTGYATHGQDTAKVRGIIGTVTTHGPGSARGGHFHAAGTPGAMGPINGVNAQVTCPQGNPNCRALEIAAVGEGEAHGILFGTSGPGQYDYLIHAEQPRVTRGFALLPTGRAGGRIQWAEGGAIYSPAAGVIVVEGALRAHVLDDLDRRVRALEGR